MGDEKEGAAVPQQQKGGWSSFLKVCDARPDRCEHVLTFASNSHPSTAISRP